ncbi:unnamed protein product [Cuscuta epithymum]|uniref:BED-type domain-containing protein n=1 Tax=Cuscuta epithymum TaxID=186058 RepID=A0AAV0C9V5_9ASTE|nr:unnamed protein product [Cuscuta epithymum]
MADNEGDTVYDPANDPARRAKSNDPGWNHGFWPDLNNKDIVQCRHCNKQMSSGIKRLKQHLAGGYGDVAKCPHTTTELMTEMRAYLMRKSRSKPIQIEDDGDEDDAEVPFTQIDTSTSQPSSGTATKRKNAASQFFNVPPKMPKQNKSIASIIRKTPEEVVDERHAKGPTQTTLEQCTKSKEEKERVFMHISDFFMKMAFPLMQQTPGVMRSWWSRLGSLDQDLNLLAIMSCVYHFLKKQRKIQRSSEKNMNLLGRNMGAHSCLTEGIDT